MNYHCPRPPKQPAFDTSLLMWRRRLLGGAAPDAYAVGGFEPEFVADFSGSLNSGTEYYRSGGADTTFSSVFTHSGLVLPATMTDSDGNLKWAPHNLVLNSASPATQSITVVSGADYTVEITGSGSVALSGAGSGTVTAGNPVEITASTTSLTLTVTGSPTTMWAYRSDLGGMVNNPDTSSTYVATTGSAKFLPRRNHYLYNGSTYDNAGILIESAAATNLCTDSTMSTAEWIDFNASDSASSETDPAGTTNARLLTTSATNGAFYDSYTGLSTSATHNMSVYAKSGNVSTVRLEMSVAGNGYYVDFNLSAGTAGSVTVAGTGGAVTMTSPTIENVGGGWYRCAVNVVTTASVNNFIIRAVGASGSTIHLYGAQFEVGSTPTSLIPTSGSTVTRAAETLTVAGSNLPANTTAMSFQVSGKMTYADLDTGSASSTSGQFSFVDWTSDVNNFIKMQIGTASARTGEIGYKARSSGTFDIVASGITLYSPGIAVGYNLGMRMTSSALNGAADGSSFTENATLTSIASLSSQSLKIAASDTNHFYGSVKLFRMWGTDIGDSGIETAST